MMKVITRLSTMLLLLISIAGYGQSAGPSQYICEGSTVTMAATGSGTWTAIPGNPAATTIANPSSATTTVSGFTVAGVYGYSWGTAVGDTMYVTVSALPAAPTGVTASPNSICAGQTSGLTATSAGNNINWYTTSTGGSPIGTVASGTSLIVTPSSTTTYYAEAQTATASGPDTFRYTGSIVNWTVPAGVTSITITALGAAGGYYTGATPGYGASMTGTFAVTPGQVLSILVGQCPGLASAEFYVAGGGGTFVALGASYATATPMIVAGGGGGGSPFTTPSTGVSAPITTSGTGTSPGTSGDGAPSVDCGGGGGGFYTSGAADALYSYAGGAGFQEGGAGGVAAGYQTGGFGGGAPADYDGSCNNVAGAGGGYSGGSGFNNTTDNASGQAGGSYNGGTSQVNVAGANSNTDPTTNGNGLVIIDITPIPGCASSTRVPVTVTVTGTPPTPVTVTPGAITQCGGTVTLNATGGTGGTIYWQNTTSNGTSQAHPASSEVVSASGTYYFNAYNGNCWGVQDSAIVTINPLAANPTSVTATPPSICAGQTSELSAISAGNGINWWTAATGGTELTTVASGTNYPVTPSVTTTYYAESQVPSTTGLDTFLYTGAVQTFTVPSGVSSLTIDARGASGGTDSSYTNVGGLGARVQTTLAVSAGQVLNIYVGGRGANTSDAGGVAGAGGYNGGGSGGTGVCCGGGGGGGASDIRIGGTAWANIVVDAGGGGGGGGYGFGVSGSGGAGGQVGANGSNGTTATGGIGATQSSNGAGGGAGTGSSPGSAGSVAPGAYQGGAGGTGSNNGGGGGGGGYYAGGGGGGDQSGAYAGGGGGGSSYSAGTSTTYTSGYQSGNGVIYISFTPTTGCPSATRVPVTVTVSGTPPPPVVVTPGTITQCGGTVTLNASGGTGGTIYWQDTTSNGFSMATPASTESVSTSGTYYFNAFNGSCWSLQDSAIVTINPIPAAPTTATATPSSICAGQISELNAISTGNNINWWTAATGGTLDSTVGSGANYPVTPGATTTYYAESQTIAVGGPDTIRYTGSIVNWTVPAGVTSLTVTAIGAAGGYYTGATPGYGASMTGTFAVTGGQVLSVLVGQCPGLASGEFYVAGGGGTFVALGASYATATPLIVAGGGGGGSPLYSPYAGVNAPITPSGTGSSPGTGGDGAPSVDCGGGGGGFYTSGAADALYAHAGGAGFQQGGAGGVAAGYQTGGFGGGAPSDYLGSCYTVAGAGGGYGGGSGNPTTGDDASGQAGGSYNSGTSQTNIAGFNSNTNPTTHGNGLVILTYATSGACASVTRTPVTVTVIGTPPPPVTVTPTSANQCGGTVTLNASGGSGGTIYWQNTTSNGTSTATPASSEVVSSTGTYYFNAFNGLCWSIQDSSNVTIIPIPAAPSPVTATPSAICTGQTSELNAIATGYNINWWTAASGGTQLTTVFSGTNYPVTPAGTTTYYAEASVIQSATYLFTTAGDTDMTGPDQGGIDSAYAGTNLAGHVTITTPGIQQWTVPASGNYTFSVNGASGGTSTYAGHGANVTGTVNLTAGTVLDILVGQMGSNLAPTNSDGGGGGSFVTAAGTLYFAAGGGGGGAQTSEAGNAQDASTSTAVVSSAATEFGSVGAGYNTNGSPMTFGGAYTVAQSFTNGGNGEQGGSTTAFGNPGVPAGDGGFGGGGASCSCSQGGGGGGGGYVGGGGGGDPSTYASGYGGSSYIIPAATGRDSTVLTTYGNGSVTITYAGSGVCVSTTRTPVTVTVNTIPPATVSPSGSVLVCSGLTQPLTVTPTAGATYTWYENSVVTPQTSNVDSVDTVGTYQVIVTSNGCSDTSALISVQLSAAPNMTITATAGTVCPATTDTLSVASGYTSYSWSGSVDSTSSTVVTTGGNYTVTVTNGACRDSATIAIIQGVNTPVPTIAVTGTLNLCGHDSVTLTSSAPTGNLWSNSATTQSITDYNAGIFTVTAVGACGNATSAPDTVTSVTSISVSLGPDTGACTGTPLALLAATSAPNVMWSTGATTFIDTITASGQYWVVASQSGCVASDTVNVTFSTAPGLIATDSAGILTTTSVPGATYLWYKDGVLIPGQNSTVLNTNLYGYGNYAVQAVVGYCYGVIEQPIDIGPLGISGTSQTISCSVYPNPTNKEINIIYNLSQDQDLDISIMDLTGRTVSHLFSGNQVSGSYTLVTDLTSLAGGIYFVNFKTSEGTLVKKVTKE